MIANIALHITDYFIRKNIICEEDKAIYQYGFEMGISQTINIITTLTIGFIMRMPLESITFLLCFLTLRTYSGGYHASSNLKCYILSTLMTIIVLTASYFVNLYNLYHAAIICGITGAGLLVLLAPVDDANKVMDMVERVVFRKRAMRALFMWLVIVVILFFTPLNSLSVVLCLCFFSIGIMVFCGYWKNHFLNKQI